MRFTDVLAVLSGLAIFLYGMEVMGSGFKHMAGGKLQDVLEKLTKKPFVAMMAGMLVTALVQSSGATTSMLVSFVNAGIMKVTQTVYVILGSNVGTTITGQIVALGMFGSGNFDVNVLFSSLGDLLFQVFDGIGECVEDGNYTVLLGE